MNKDQIIEMIKRALPAKNPTLRQIFMHLDTFDNFKLSFLVWHDDEQAFNEAKNFIAQQIKVHDIEQEEKTGTYGKIAI